MVINKPLNNRLGFINPGLTSISLGILWHGRMENSWPPQPRIRNLLDVTWRMRICRTSPNVPNGRVFMPIVYLFWLMQNNVCWLLNVIDLFFQWLAFVGSLFRFSNAHVAFLHDMLLLIEPD